MDPFHAEAPCPVCERVGAGFDRHDADCERFGHLGPHMHRACGNCGHEWAEQARDLAGRRTTARRVAPLVGSRSKAASAVPGSTLPGRRDS